MPKKLFSILFLTMLCFFFFSFQNKKDFNLKESINRGKDIYLSYCLSCHLEQGEGIESLYPPIANSDYLMKDKKRSIHEILYGLDGEIKVNGISYNIAMSGFDFNDQQTSDVLNYIRNSFGNKGEAVTPDKVKSLRKK